MTGIAFTSDFFNNHYRPCVPYLLSSSLSSRVPKSQHTHPNVPVPLSPSHIYTQPHSISQLLAIFSGVDYQRTVSKYRKRKRKSLSSVHILHETWNQALIITSCQGKRKGKCKKSLIKMHIQSHCFANPNIMPFCCSHCHHHHHCLSSIIFHLCSLREQDIVDSNFWKSKVTWLNFWAMFVDV